MRLEFKEQAFEGLSYWVLKHPKVAKKVMRLIEESKKNPFGGIGKSEPLKNELSGWWSKRIDGEHRLILKWKRIFSLSLKRGGIMEINRE